MGGTVSAVEFGKLGGVVALADVVGDAVDAGAQRGAMVWHFHGRHLEELKRRYFHQGYSDLHVDVRV